MEARGRALAAADRLEWLKGERVARSDAGKPTDAPPSSRAWHDVRAKSLRETVGKAALCHETSKFVQLTCSNCGDQQRIPIGCGQTYFCQACRVRAATRFRAELLRKIEGLTGAAARAGLTSRHRRRAKGGRFTEKLITLTVPHEGGPGARVRLRDAAHAKFLRRWQTHWRERLASLAAHVEQSDPETGEVFELTLLDFVHGLGVNEWTLGADDFGHPHVHRYAFCPFIPHHELQSFWAESLAEVQLRTAVRVAELEPGKLAPRKDGKPWDAQLTAVVAEDGSAYVPIVDVRMRQELEREGKTIEGELVKYLLKEWERDESGTRLARPEVFAEVYAATHGKRQRQTSSGFAHFAARKHTYCECCGHESAERFFARIAIRWRVELDALERRKGSEPPRWEPPVIPNGPPERRDLEQQMAAAYADAVAAAWSPEATELVERIADELRAFDESARRREFDGARDREWSASLELAAMRLAYTRGVRFETSKRRERREWTPGLRRS